MLSSPILDICLFLIVTETVFMFSISSVSDPVCSVQRVAWNILLLGTILDN